ncbi:hypothetical protein ADEAN_000918200 [Angomonas deanei]|uniref:Uncharacterized protein n=1 Tax=Angomonas deanei TaxID=59799 RepID=A0A7G2CPD4_9TRYP|nr:hypothetical protein ADEAN_000918200 [Angomonas deanei]
MNTDSLLKLNPPDQFADVGVCQSTKVPIKLCYNIFYPPTSHNNSGVETLPVILLIQGLSSPGLFFDNQFCRALSNHNNKRCAVIRFDNRDIGKSTFIEPKTNNHNNNAQNTGSSSGTILQYAYAMVNPSKRYSIHSLYTIDDMAKDALGLLTALEKKEQENNNNKKRKVNHDWISPRCICLGSAWVVLLHNKWYYDNPKNLSV